jgi:hypothetical protein
MEHGAILLQSLQSLSVMCAQEILEWSALKVVPFLTWILVSLEPLTTQGGSSLAILQRLAHQPRIRIRHVYHNMLEFDVPIARTITFAVLAVA